MTIENLIKCCDNLTPTENQFGNYVLQHKEKIENCTIQQLVEEAYVSKSAIHRFCKKIGLYGFSELKVKLAQDMIKNIRNEQLDVNFPILPKDNSSTIAQKMLYLYQDAVVDTFNFINSEELDKVIYTLHKAKVIDIYAQAHNINVAENFKDKMRSIGRVVNCSESFYEQRCMATASDNTHAAIILSYSGKATFLPQITGPLRKRGVKTIFIGKAGNESPKDNINHRLNISDRENLRSRISQFSSHIGMQYMMDVIYGCIFRIDYDKNLDYIKEVIDIIDDRSLNEDE